MSIYRGRTRREVYLASLLYDAIDDGDISSVKIFLSVKGADCNLVLPKQGIAPFHLAIGNDSEEFALNITTLLLQHGANPNIRSEDGLTPMHIAAAYGRCKILKLLLCCGGDPEQRDDNYKTPSSYAQEENFKECINLLKSYTHNTINIFDRTQEIPSFNMKLEKILVNNGATVGEYELIQEYKTEDLTRKNLESLHQLPETNTTEYVMKWCQSHSELPPPNESFGNTTCPNEPWNSSDFIESSFDESDGTNPARINPINITFRKVYRKKRKISTSSNKSNISTRTPSKLVPSDSPSSNNKSLVIDIIGSDTQAEDFFTNLEDFSQESGIVTLPNSSKTDCCLVHDRVTGLDLTMQSISVEKDILDPSKSLNGSETAINSSSDYNTCSSGALVGQFEQNVLDITQDLSANIIENVRNAENVAESVKSEGGSTEVSFVSVSEVYKYIDEKEGIILFEKRFLKPNTSDYSGSIKSSSLSSSHLSSIPASVDTDVLRKELTLQGYNPGPITLTTKRVYLRKLKQLRKQPILQIDEKLVPAKKVYSIELEKTIKDNEVHWLKDLAAYKALEEVLVKEFVTPNASKKWREGVCKSNFTYLLLDSRVTNNLPCRAELIDTKEIWETFISSIFYVGKGKRTRPYAHLYEAVTLWNQHKRTSSNKKLNHILNIWNDNRGVICLHVFQNVIPVEAYTREAAIISALKVENLTNIKNGEFYGIVSTWPQRQRKMLGVYLLYKAMMIFLNEGERQLCPADI